MSYLKVPWNDHAQVIDERWNGMLRLTHTGTTATFTRPTKEALAGLFERVQNEIMEIEKLYASVSEDVGSWVQEIHI
jgi:hypothetical protein